MSAPVTGQKAATVMLARYAEIHASLDLIEAERAEGLAAANVAADVQAAPLLTEAAKIKSKLETWWTLWGHTLTAGKRKTVELGGCTIGTQAGRDMLGLPADAEAALEAMKAERWAKPFVRVTASIDKVAVKAALGSAGDGAHGEKLSALGFWVDTPPATFVLKRVAQAGVVGVQ